MDDALLHLGGVEVIWRDSYEDCEKFIISNNETRKHEPDLLPIRVPRESELVYQHEDDNFVQYYKLVAPS